MQKTFFLKNYNFNPKTSELSLAYSQDNKHNFEEKFIFHGAKRKFTKNELKVLDKAFFYLHTACGISYYKSFVSPNIKIENNFLTKSEAKFFNEFYLKGLGEFAFTNKLKLSKVIKFPHKNQTKERLPNIKLKRRSLVPLGGGKDSVTAAEILKNNKEEICLISGLSSLKNIPPAIKTTAQTSKLPYIFFERKICQEFLKIDKDPNIKTYNGHVPITGIWAFTLLACSVLYDYDSAILANEQSANFGNIKWDGMFVNHQYSKSFEFEKVFHDFVQKNVLKNFNYFSFLRPLSEIQIVKLFSKFKKYHSVFTSCNKAFKINEKKRIDYWCCECDKCRFVFLIAAPFFSKEKLIQIFGKNLLDDKTQLDGYKELLGLKGHKPFECVGEIEESILGLLMLQNTEFENDRVVKKLLPLLQKYNLEKLSKKYISFSKEHLLNKKYLNYLESATKEKIAIWGFGVEGQSAYKYFSKQELTILNNDKIKDAKNYKANFVIGEENVKKELENFDTIIKSSGISIYKPEVIKAVKHGVKFASVVSVFFEEWKKHYQKHKKPITIAITGTKGKSTTAALLNHILKNLGYKTEMGGNIGIATTDLIPKLSKLDFVIIELSSYQTSILDVAPEITVLLNLYPEHLQWHLTHENYYKDKANLLNIGKDNIKIVNAKDVKTKKYVKAKNLTKYNSKETINYKSGSFYDDSKKIFDLKFEDTNLRGEHNFSNISVVLTILKKLKIKLDSKVKNAIKTFRPLPHRLEIIKTTKNITYVNDSISTIPEATINAIKSFPKQDIYLILGGFDREQKFDELAKFIVKNKQVKKIVVLGQTQKRIIQEFKKAKYNEKDTFEVKDLKEAVAEFKKVCKKGVVLLSPAAPSYDQYKNFIERGEAFRKLVN